MSASLGPDGIGHLERGELTNDLTTARDFDLGMTGPPMFMNMDFIASGLVELLGGVASAIVLLGFAWWAPVLLLGAWGRTHWLLRESGVWRDRNTDEVQARRSGTPTTPTASPSTRRRPRRSGSSACAGWTDRPLPAHRRRPVRAAVRSDPAPREVASWRPVASSLVANVCVFSVARPRGARRGGLDLARRRGLRPGSRSGRARSRSAASTGPSTAPPHRSAAVLRLRPAMAAAGALPRAPAGTLAPPRRGSRQIRSATSRSPTRPERPMLDGFDLTMPAGASLAIVGQNGAGKTTLAKLLCRLYDPDSGSIEVDGVDLRDLDIDAWRVAADRGLPGLRALRPVPARQRRTARCARRRVERRCATPAPTIWPTSTPPWPRATPAAPTCPAASGSGSRWHARSCAVDAGAGAGPARRADGPARRAGRGGDLRPRPRGDARRAPRSWSRTGSPRCARPTGSRARARARHSSSAATTS